MKVTRDSEKTLTQIAVNDNDNAIKGLLSVFGLYLSIALLGGFVYGLARLVRYFAEYVTHVR